mmetsp:Transcript_11942/g.18318  ORF Transcript_11942/g.18318 Transcript_11942/m.18318 type:complete len:268 (+) Transcript_11942:107-910(+)
MMQRVNVFVFLLCCQIALAFTTISNEKQATTCLRETKEDLVVLAKKLNPLIGFYDPLNLAEADLFDNGNEATIGFLRHAEIKHGRVAMAAFIGYIVHANEIRFPFPMKLDGTPFPQGDNPPELWDAIPDAGKYQIFFLIFLLELWGETSTENHVHYMREGGIPGKYPDFPPELFNLPNLFNPFNFPERNDQAKERGLRAELNNGRLAMIGIMGFLAAQTVPESVPSLRNHVLPDYQGEVMAPFSENAIIKAIDAVREAGCLYLVCKP